MTLGTLSSFKSNRQFQDALRILFDGGGENEDDVFGTVRNIFRVWRTDKFLHFM